jgi:hypothetical protein
VLPEQRSPVEFATPRTGTRSLPLHAPLRTVASYGLGGPLQAAGCAGRRTGPGEGPWALGLEMMPGLPVGERMYIAHFVGCVLRAESVATNVGRRRGTSAPTVAAHGMLGGISIGKARNLGPMLSLSPVSRWWGCRDRCSPCDEAFAERRVHGAWGRQKAPRRLDVPGDLGYADLPYTRRTAGPNRNSATRRRPDQRSTDSRDATARWLVDSETPATASSTTGDRWTCRAR